MVLVAMMGSLYQPLKIQAEQAQENWMVCYSCDFTPAAFDPYDLVILDSANYTLAARLVDRGKSVLGYLSLGEVEKNRPWFTAVSQQGLLLQENRNWKGSYMIDVRDSRWTTRVIEKLIPEMLRRGFQGVFLDTLDNAAELERIDKNKYRGMTAAAASLVRTIRRHYPQIKIMMNRAYDILPEVGQYIDMELGESVYTDYNFAAKTYGYVEKKNYQLQVSWLKNAAKKFPDLKIYTLDYWNPEDKPGIAKIYETQNKNGFIPLVSTIALNQIIPKPQP